MKAIEIKFVLDIISEYIIPCIIVIGFILFIIYYKICKKIEDKKERKKDMIKSERRK